MIRDTRMGPACLESSTPTDRSTFDRLADSRHHPMCPPARVLHLTEGTVRAPGGGWRVGDTGRTFGTHAVTRCLSRSSGRSGDGWSPFGGDNVV